MKLLFISLIVLLTCTESPKAQTFEPIVVLELFTFQGCSSCPPADDLLNEVKNKYGTSKVIALSYHVDYWNYIGWKDPFSKSEYSYKQRQYGHKFNSSIYTPQMVVNGEEHFVGSNEGILKSKIKQYSNKKAQNMVTISNIKKESHSIKFDYKVEGDYSKKKLRVALIIDERITSISTGENKNRRLKNSNIVVEDLEIKLNKETGNATINIPNLVMDTDQLSLISIIETTDLHIVGVNVLKL